MEGAIFTNIVVHTRQKAHCFNNEYYQLTKHPLIMKYTLKNVFWVVLLGLLGVTTHAQNTITGTITENATGNPVPFVNIIVKGTSNGTSSDLDGNFTITVSNLPATIVVSSVGYKTAEQEITTEGNVMIALDKGDSLDEVILVGNRAKPRTILESPVPIDNIGIQELRKTGQPTVDKMLTFKVPSYNATQQTISDATAHFDPAELRGLGPSRTLVLINGKRKNASALVYINDTPGKGEVGTDMKSIPTAALERVEVLRDGASAQYGSDAIAGVVNIVLRKDVGKTSVNVFSGITAEGDGFTAGADVNRGFSIFKDNGFINLTADYLYQEETNRAGEPGDDVLFGIAADDPDWASWLQSNPDLGMTVGQPEVSKFSLFYNSGVDISENAELYSFGGATFRDGTSFALYRAPYWVPDPFNLLHEAGTTYNGFQPTFETDIRDYSFDVGVKGTIGEWGYDLSTGIGSNSVDYTIGNTLNPALGASSPTSFEAGGYEFSDWILNFDVNRIFGDFGVALGAEYRNENFIATAGQSESYVEGGAQSFPGLQPQNAVDEDRNNIGVYGDFSWDATEDFLLTAALRYEDYSDFGDNFSWKVSSRYKFNDNKGAVRASYSTGFRAPSLHQIFLSNVQTLISGGTVSNQGTFNNVDPIIREGLGVPQLTAETAQNFSVGITIKPTSNLYFSLDYYNVRVDDRVLFTGEIGFDGDDDTTNPVEDILIANSITSLKFFVNAVNTVTNGADIVIGYNNIVIGSGSLDASIAANFNETKIDGEIEAPALLAQNGYEIFNRKEQSRITSSRPKSKIVFGLNYELDKWDFTLNNTYFGSVTWRHSNNGLNGAPLGPGGANLPTDDAAYDQTFAGKVITDLAIAYQITNQLGATLSANNLLDVYPDEIETQGDFVTDLGGRFKYPWEVNQFGFRGAYFQAGLNYTF